MKTKPKTLFVLAAMAALVVGLIGAPVAAQDDDEKRVQVHVKKMKVKGDSDEETRVIFIDEDGNQSEFHGKDFDWVSASGDDHHVFIDRMHGGSGAFLGVQMTELTDELRAHFGVPEGEGVMVSKVVEGSPAYIAGVRVGDIITAIDGDTVKGAAALGSVIGKREVGEQVAVQLYRDGGVETLSATLAENERHVMHRRNVKKIQIECEDGDCRSSHGVHALHLKELDCDDEECDVLVNCDDQGCECTVNGETQECSALGLEHP